MRLIVTVLPPKKLNLLELAPRSKSSSSGRSKSHRRPWRLAISLLALFLTQSWSPLSGQSPQTSSATVPPQLRLSDPELRTVLGQLFELQALRVEIRDIKANQEAEAKLLETERALMAQKLELEQKAADLARQETALKERELKLAEDQITFYSTSLKICQSNKKTSFGCKLKKVFTLWLARCK